MKINEILWLQRIVDKLAVKHRLTREEVEEVLSNKPQYRFLESGDIDGEDVYSAYGRTDAGRYVTVIFVFKPGNCALVITARDMDQKERRQYKR